MGKKYDKGYDDGWYNGYQRGLKDGENGVAFVPEFATTSYTGTGCIICGGMLGNNFVCVNHACPASQTVSSCHPSVEPDGKV